MAATAMAIGHEYMVQTDHSARLTIAHGLNEERLAAQLDRDAALDFLMTHTVQPALGEGTVFLSGFPASQAAMAALVNGAGLTITGPNIFGVAPKDGDSAVELAVVEQPFDSGPDRLVYHPQRFCIGVGCARNADPEELWQLVQTSLAEANISPGSVAAVGSIDLKADEPAIIALAKRFGVPLRPS